MPTESATPGAGDSQEEYADDARGNAQRWGVEFEASKKNLKRWRTQAKKVVNRYLDEQDAKASSEGDTRKSERRLNLFNSNTQMLMSILYGKTPKVDVTRKWGDASDEVARVAGVIQERLLNGDIEKDSDTYALVVQLCLEDRLLPGFALARCRYVADMEEPEEGAVEEEAIQGPPGPDGLPVELAPAVPAVAKTTREAVEIDHINWGDVLYSPCKTFLEMRWLAIKGLLDRRGLVEKFGDAGKRLPLNAKTGRKSDDGKAAEDPWGRAEVWEIWDKERKCVWWLVEGWPETLIPEGVEGNPDGSVPDPLGLDGFWPFPRPMVSNTTTSGFVPKPDFVIAQDLYNQIDDLETRIYVLQKAIRVRGVYDKSAGPDLERLLDEGDDNTMIPVSGWAAFMEKGGLERVVQFLPLEMLVAALSGLRDLQAEKMRQLDQITGMGDVIRGQSNETATTATENKLKGMFASVRVQAIQDDFARFCSELQRIKAEIISLRFDADTIKRESNIENTPDAQLADQAVALIKDKFYQFRIQVKPESVSLTDFAALQNEGQAFIQGMAGYFTSAMPMAQAFPGASGFLLELAQWYASRFRSSSTVQGIFDRAIDAAKKMEQQQAAQPPQPPPPDPRMMAQQAKTQGDLAKIQAQSQAEAQGRQEETQQLAIRQQNEARLDVEKERAKTAIKTQAELMKPHPPPMGVPQ